MNKSTDYSTGQSLSSLPSLNPCLLGQGITCGLMVGLHNDSSIRVGAGTAILPNGTVLRITQREFWNYRKHPQSKVTAYFGKTRIWELTDDEPGNSDDIDSIVPQYRTDSQPGSSFLDDKVLVIYVDEEAKQPLTFVLVRDVDMVRLSVLENEVRRLTEPARQQQKGGLFTNPRTALSFDAEHVEAALFPYRQLPHISLARFGYKALAIKEKNKKWNENKPTVTGKPETFGKLDNLQNPFEAIANLSAKRGQQIPAFKTIFNEYKAILDEGFPAFRLALRVLHTQFGSLLSGNQTTPTLPYPKTARPKETSCSEPVQDSFASYREVLCRKWQCFKEEGEHLYYIQYFYDWLADLLMAYNELRQALANFSAECHCDDVKPDSSLVHLLKLGPVISDEFNHKPLIFRDYFSEPFTYNHNEERLREIKCLHHRLMMMIWTFDLPALQLERKVLVNGGYIDRAEEFEDSTDYWESLITRKSPAGKIIPDKQGKPVFDLSQLPVGITPSRALTEPLGQQAIPYYYPLDGNSPYSVHRFWDFAATKTNRIDLHLSYNAHQNDDSYTEQPDSLFPLAFNIRQRPFLRVEGHIGRTIVIDEPQPENLPELDELINKYNLCLEVVAVNISKLIPIAVTAQAEPSGLEVLLGRLKKLRGLEHQNGGYGGQTLLLFYVSQAEQIELNECKKDTPPEIPANTIVADFTLPFLVSTINPTL